MATYTITESGQFSSLTLSGGDIITTSDEIIAEFWDVNQSGTSGSQITFSEVSLDGGAERSYCMDITGQGYITLENVVLSNSTTRNLWGDSAANGVAINGLVSTGGVIGVWLRAKSNSEYKNITVTGQTGAGFYLSNASSDVAIENLSVTGGAATAGSIGLWNIANLTLKGITLRDTTSTGIIIRACSGLLEIDGVDVDNSGDATLGSVHFKENLEFSSGSFVKNIEITNSNGRGIFFYDSDCSPITGDGWLVSGSSGTAVGTTGASLGHVAVVRIDNSGYSGIEALVSGTASYSDVIIADSAWDGISASGSATISCSRAIVYGSGTAEQPNSGDGFTAHDTSEGNVCKFSLFYSNKNTALAVIGATGGVFTNNTCVDNHESGFVRGTLWFSAAGGAGWVCKNNIVVNNTTGDDYAGVLVMVEDGADMPTMDYNCYFSSTNSTPFWVHNGGATGTAADYDKYTFSEWQTYSSQDANSVFSDPLFVDYSGGDYRLSSLSPCKNAGVMPFSDGNGDISDLAGELIFSDESDSAVQWWVSGPDIGAYSYTFVIDSQTVEELGRAKYNLTVESGTTWADFVLTAPAAPELIAADDGTLFTDGVPNEIDATDRAAMTGDQFFFHADKGLAVYDDDLTGTDLAKADKFFRVE